MIKPENIPEEAWQAAMLAYKGGDAVVEILCAALNAWPDAQEVRDFWHVKTVGIGLPLVSEETDDPA